jgi:cellulose biosynthesis protein BcsQ
LSEFFLMHSFKGGAGRTVTTANVATVLAKDMGKRVLLIDLDLESAGTTVLFNLEREFEDTRECKSVQDILRGDIRADLPMEEFREAWKTCHRQVTLNFGADARGSLKIMPSRQRGFGHDERSSFELTHARNFRSFIEYVGEIDEFDLVLVDAPSGIQGPALFGLQFCDHLCEFVRWTRQFTRGTEKFLSDLNGVEGSRIQSVLVVPVAVPDEKPADEAVLKNLGDRANHFRNAVERVDRDLKIAQQSQDTRARFLREVPVALDLGNWTTFKQYLAGISENPLLKWEDAVFGLDEYSGMKSASVKKAVAEYRLLANAIVEESERFAGGV